MSERDGRTVTSLVAVNGTYDGQRSDVVAFDATVTVAESGRVLSLTRSWTRGVENVTNSYAETVTWSAATPVERPGWTANATPANDTQDANDEQSRTENGPPSDGALLTVSEHPRADREE